MGGPQFQKPGEGASILGFMGSSWGCLRDGHMDRPSNHRGPMAVNVKGDSKIQPLLAG